jgi:hypothetical protein
MSAIVADEDSTERNFLPAILAAGMGRPWRQILSGRVVDVARIGLANVEPRLAGALESSLRRRAHFVQSVAARALDQVDFQIDELSLDLIIIDISSEDSAARNLLTNLLRLRIETGMRPMVLCIFRAYRGAQFEYELERRGARVAYLY